MVSQPVSLNTAFSKTFLCISRLVLCTASLGVISFSLSLSLSLSLSRVLRLALASRPRFRAFTPLTPRDRLLQASISVPWTTHVQVQALSIVVDRGTSHKPPKVPASIIPFVLDSVSEARPADQVICRRNLAGTCGKNIAETDSSATEITWTTGEDSLNCPQRPWLLPFGNYSAVRQGQ